MRSNSAAPTAASSSASAALAADCERLQRCRRIEIERANRQRRAAVVTHPVTGRRCWFNQIAFLNEWTMDRDVRDFLKQQDVLVEGLSVDEAPQAYKDIDRIMRLQIDAGLVEILARMRPVAVIMAGAAGDD